MFFIFYLNPVDGYHVTLHESVMLCVFVTEAKLWLGVGVGDMTKIFYHCICNFI